MITTPTPRPLTELPLTSQGRVAWKRLLAAAAIGDTYTIPLYLRSSAVSATNYSGLAIRTANNGDGTVTMTITAPHDNRRERLLTDFHTLSTGVLQALHDAATKSGLFSNSSS